MEIDMESQVSKDIVWAYKLVVDKISRGVDVEGNTKFKEGCENPKCKAYLILKKAGLI